MYRARPAKDVWLCRGQPVHVVIGHGHRRLIGLWRAGLLVVPLVEGEQSGEPEPFDFGAFKQRKAAQQPTRPKTPSTEVLR